MASEAIGGNMYMDTKVIKVADFKSEVKWPPRLFWGRHGLRGHLRQYAHEYQVPGTWYMKLSTQIWRSFSSVGTKEIKKSISLSKRLKIYALPLFPSNSYELMDPETNVSLGLELLFKLLPAQKKITWTDKQCCWREAGWGRSLAIFPRSTRR